MPPYSAHFRFFRIEQSRVRYGDSMSRASACLAAPPDVLRKDFREYHWFKAYFPLTPRSYVPYPVALGSGAASFGNPFGAYFIGHGPVAAWAYGDILLVQEPDRLHFVTLLEPPQELPAADQVPAYGDQLPLVLVA